jgi:hypothetical protein
MERRLLFEATEESIFKVQMASAIWDRRGAFPQPAHSHSELAPVSFISLFGL